MLLFFLAGVDRRFSSRTQRPKATGYVRHTSSHVGGILPLPGQAQPCQVQNPAPLLETAQETAGRFFMANLAGGWA